MRKIKRMINLILPVFYNKMLSINLSERSYYDETDEVILDCFVPRNDGRTLYKRSSTEPKVPIWGFRGRTKIDPSKSPQEGRLEQVFI